MKRKRSLLFVFAFVLGSAAADWAAEAQPAASNQASRSVDQSPPATSPTDSAADQSLADEVQTPWDYRPYRVLIWLSSDDPAINAAALDDSLRSFLDRDFAAIWRTDILDAPTAIAALAGRDLGRVDFDLLTSTDPVLAVKRDHPDAVRIRSAKNVGEFCRQVLATQRRIDQARQAADVTGDATLAGVAPRLTAVDGDEATVSAKWADPATESLLVASGIGKQLSDPEAKLIPLPIDGLISQSVEQHDKIFVVHVRRDRIPGTVEAVEIDTLMQHTGPVTRIEFSATSAMSAAIGHALIQAFAPVVRIENAGMRSAVGLLRAGGLIVDEDSPAAVNVGDPLEPMIRKNDRNGRPTTIGRMDWALLLATEPQGRFLKMDFYAGRSGTLQGRKNKRTFRMAFKARPRWEATKLRLHLKNDVDFPLIGYELYERELESREMTFVGRTDWNGSLTIQKSPSPLRLLYVKNGGAVLARLPLVPGLYQHAVADLTGDDLRLQAEAYVRGIQNEITDLVAIRELYKARIRLLLEKGDLRKAEELMHELRNKPNHEALSTEISRKQIDFLKVIGTKNLSQRRKVDEMFTTTRELLSKYVTPKLIRELEADLVKARASAGQPPADDSTPGDATSDADAAADAAKSNGISSRGRPADQAANSG